MSNRPVVGAAYRHVDGGLYRVIDTGKSTVDLMECVIYKHLYPFEVAIWIRPLDEWTPERFTLITDEVALLKELALTDRKVRQQEITEAKAARRAAK